VGKFEELQKIREEKKSGNHRSTGTNSKVQKTKEEQAQVNLTGNEG